MLTRWVGLEDLRTESLVPGFYDPAYLEVDRMLREGQERFVEVGDLIETIRLQQASEQDPIPTTSTLREEAIFIPRHLPHHATQIPITYKDVSGGESVGEFERLMTVFGPKSTASIAWIAHELRQPYCQTQLRRAGESGTILRHITPSDVLRTRIKRLSSGERDRLNRLEKNHGPEFGSRSIVRGENDVEQRASAPTLVWSTHEERRQEFERYIAVNVDAVPLAFVEAVTSNQKSDLFAFRLLFDSERSPRLEFEEGSSQSEANRSWWKDWYWEGTADGAVVCQSLFGDERALPIHFLNRVALPLAIQGMGPNEAEELLKFWRTDANGRLLLPATSQVRELVEIAIVQDVPMAQLEENRTFLAGYLVLDGLDQAEQERCIGSANDFMSWLFRPILAIRLVREQQTIGAYLLAGRNQFVDPAGEGQRMHGLGQELLRLLGPGDLASKEAVRKESLRRLSWFSHQINSPIGIAAAALRDVRECLENHATIAEMLVPDPKTASQVARMAKQPIECYQMLHRLDVALQAIQDLRRVNYQIRQLRRIQGDLALAECDLTSILNEEVCRARASLPGVLISQMPETGITLVADAQFLKEAFQEVFNNSLRELKARKTENPCIQVHLSQQAHEIHVSIGDNALPPLNNLIEQPFEEDASTYATLGQGSGLGLTMVREIMLRHGGSCSLEENIDEEGQRHPGVTFHAILPIHKEPKSQLLPL